MVNPDADQQRAQAEEILGERLEERAFVKSLFAGQFVAETLPPYPMTVAPAAREMETALREFCRERIDPVAIDRDARIPDDVVRGLGELGVLGACLPPSSGGRGFTQTSYCRLLEVLGGHCASTALFVNAHHSIGPRAIVLFGTRDQQRQWLPKLASGEWLSAFALTEPEAGSDAANVQSLALPTADGQAFRLNGEKRWITNGGIAQVLTVMARTPMPGSRELKISAFIVTPDMSGFEVVEERMAKCGVRGTVTSRLAFHDVLVPRANLLGALGKGLKIALTVLDFGRTTFGASCTGAAKYCLARTAAHVQQRVQFGRPLASFGLVREKIAGMQSSIYAMEACTYQTAALIDAQSQDFMLETAMLKVFSTEVLWRIVTDSFQLFGGRAYFNDEPFERIMRDARINMIGEGANDVLRIFTGLVGMRDVGLELEGVLHAIRFPVGNVHRLGRYLSRRVGAALAAPVVSVRSVELEPEAALLARLVRRLGLETERALRTYQEGIVEQQLVVARIADAATELYCSACVLRRIDAELHAHAFPEPTLRFHLQTARHYLRAASRRIQHQLAGLWNNDDQETLALARATLDAHG